MSMPIIRVHWLNQSRAFRVLWLLDHLKLEYEIIPYMREGLRAPESLKKVHPLGRSPLVEVEDRTTGKKKLLVESGYIFQYILEHFDPDHLLSNADSDMAEKIQYYLFYAEGSLQPPLFMEYVFQLAKENPGPFPISMLTRTIVDKISNTYSKQEAKNNLDYLEEEISKNGGYLVDGKLSGADILMSFPLRMAFERKFGTKESHPNISKWLQTIESTDSYAVTKEKVKKFGADM